MNFWWELVTRDDTRIEIPPSAVEVVKRRMSSGEPVHTRTMTIPVNQITKFQITDKPFSDQLLLDSAAQAFNDPVYNDEGDIMVKWVKKTVTQDRWNKFYSPSPGYKHLSDENGMIVTAFRLPIHLIDDKVSYCDDNEVNKLTSKQ